MASSVMQARDFLRVLEAPDSSISEAAAFVGLPADKAEAIANAARRAHAHAFQKRFIPTRHGARARAFLDLLRRLEIPLKDIHLISFDYKRSRSHWRTRWRAVLELREGPGFDKQRPPFGTAASSRSWLGIQPSFAFGASAPEAAGLFGFRFVMVMSYIVFGN